MDVPAVVDVITPAVNSIFGVVTQAVDFVSGNALLMIFAASGVVAIGVSVVKKLIGRY